MGNDNLVVEKVKLSNEAHCDGLLRLLNIYMEDEMGINRAMPKGLAPRIIEGLKKHKAYLGFFARLESRFIGLANCNINFSTWLAKPIINIHDLIVEPRYRNTGVGEFLLTEIEEYARETGCCKINLEVRVDNEPAQKLYQKRGFKQGEPPMLFWEKKL